MIKFQNNKKKININFFNFKKIFIQKSVNINKKKI